MSKTPYHFAVRAGDSGTEENPDGLEVAFEFKDSTGAFLPEDLTGYDFTFTTDLQGEEGAEIGLSLTSADGGVLIDLAEGKVTVPLTSAQTQSLEGLGPFRYKLQMTAVGVVRTRLYGMLTVKDWAADG